MRRSQSDPGGLPDDEIDSESMDIDIAVAVRESMANLHLVDCPPLTDRECEVLCHLVVGRPNKEIATTLKLSCRTIKFHVSNIFAKIGAQDRSHAVHLVYRRTISMLLRRHEPDMKVAEKAMRSREKA